MSISGDSMEKLLRTSMALFKAVRQGPEGSCSQDTAVIGSNQILKHGVWRDESIVYHTKKPF